MPDQPENITNHGEWTPPLGVGFDESIILTEEDEAILDRIMDRFVREAEEKARKKAERKKAKAGTDPSGDKTKGES